MLCLFNMPRISIIIPVFNARDYIVPCLESAVNQSLDDIEIILVDDHGTDDSIKVAGEFLGNYAGRKAWSILATSTNSGPGAARNLGLDAARGEYVAFLDADDWIESEFCESLYKAASRKHADLAWCDLMMDNQNGGRTLRMSNPRVSSGEFTEKKRKQFLSRFVSYFTTFIYRRQFLVENGLRFPSTRNSEDSSFLTCCLLSATRSASVGQPMYHYVQRRGSLSTRTDRSRYLQRLHSFDGLLGYAREKGLYDIYKQEIDFIYIKKAFLMSVSSYVVDNPDADVAVVKELCSALVSQVPDYKENRYLGKSLKVRIIMDMIFKHPKTAMFLLRRAARKK